MSNTTRTPGGAACEDVPFGDVPGAVRAWLVVVAALIVVTVCVGGATRLTDSGLSITEWKPLLGAIPPLNEADWNAAFASYKLIPEYRDVNAGMSLADFKVIFWWEWAHRFLGRFIGLVFLVPFLVFLARGIVPRWLRLPLWGLFVLGGLQGALGWYMVKSGLVDRIDVSQYRLAAHLGLALVIYAGTVWLVLTPGTSELARLRGRNAGGSGLAASALGLLALIYLQLIAGAFVAGMRAGRVHNTWPLMDGQFVPDGLGAMTPGVVNLFENALTVQFDHRMLGYAVAVWAGAQLWAVHMQRAGPDLRRSALWLAAAVMLQIGLGVWTLLAMVPVWLGVLHQAGAVIVLTAALVHARWAGAARVQSVPAH